MNKTLRHSLVLIGLAFIFFLIGSFIFSLIKTARSQSIVKVINQNENFARNSMQIRNFQGKGKRFSQTNFLTVQYVNKICKIDTSACPKKFQLSWLAYVQAWEVEAQQTPNSIRADELTAMIGAVSSSSLERIGTTGIERHIDAGNAITHTWQNIEMVALEYNVRIMSE